MLERRRNMAVKVMDMKGLKCPQPTLKMTIEVRNLNKGDILEVVADCATFENDVRSWCSRMNKVLLWIREEGTGVKRCRVQM
jgi:TusA-related sulfurtransferase